MMPSRSVLDLIFIQNNFIYISSVKIVLLLATKKTIDQDIFDGYIHTKKNYSNFDSNYPSLLIKNSMSVGNF